MNFEEKLSSLVSELEADSPDLFGEVEVLSEDGESTVSWNAHLDDDDNPRIVFSSDDTTLMLSESDLEDMMNVVKFFSKFSEEQRRIIMAILDHDG